MKDSFLSWFNQPISGLSGIFKIFLITFVIIPVAGFIVWMIFMIPLNFLGFIMGLGDSEVSESVCSGGRYSADC